MKRGRPALGPSIVEHFDADPTTKQRLRVLLQTLAGELSVPQACEQLAISQARFFELRNSMLQAAITSIEPKPAGRPAHPVEPANLRIQQLEQLNLDLRVHLAAAQLRQEIALTMPHLSNRHPRKVKKKTTPNNPTDTADSFRINRPNNHDSDCSTHGSSDT